MALIKSKQVSKLVAGALYGTAINVVAPSASSVNYVTVTANLTALVATAGEDGAAVADQTHYDNGAYREGYITTGRNLVQVYDAGTDKKLLSVAGDEIYGRLVFSGAAAVPATDAELGTWDGKVILDAVMVAVASSNETAIQSALNTALTNYNTAHPTPRNARDTAAYLKIMQGRDSGTSYTTGASIMDPMTMMPMYMGNAAAMRGYIISNSGLPAGTMPAGTAATTAYRVNFYTLVNGVETAYSFTGLVATTKTYTLDLVFPYLYTFEHLPNDFATGLKSVYVNDDVLVAVPDNYTRVPVTVTATNTMAKLATQYIHGTNATLYVNGQEVKSVTGEFAINETTDIIEWNAALTKYDIHVGDDVSLYYSTNGVASV